MSNCGKLFVSVLNNRENKWCEENCIITVAQFGFRKNFSTIDAVFALHSLILHFMNMNARLPCAFVDLKHAFDLVYRNALWYKLFNMGIDGNILQIFRSMYKTVKSCVRHGNNTYSDFFEISIGLRQGQTSAPAMFALFLNDLEIVLHNGPDSGLTLYEICITVLLFADDMVIVGNSVEDLQCNLNRLK